MERKRKKKMKAQYMTYDWTDQWNLDRVIFMFMFVIFLVDEGESIINNIDTAYVFFFLIEIQHMFSTRQFQ